MRKTIYLNGIVVGDVDVTGDIQKDIELIREYLKAKGLDRETTMAQAMFRQALSFCTTAAHLYHKDLQESPRNGLSAVPFVVNSAFSMELYLKTLHHLCGSHSRGHALLDLWDTLSTDTQHLVVSIAQRHGPGFRRRK